MSSTALLAQNGILPYANYKTGATTLHELRYPVQDTYISSLVTYYQMLQVKSVIQQQYRTVPYRSNETNIGVILSELDDCGVVLIGFQKSGWGGHAILAYDYGYGSWTWNGVAYDGCIYICDPNHSVSYDQKYNIYFNSKTYNWAIPAYSNMVSTYGAKFNYIGGNVSEINQGGYLSGITISNNENYVARIDVAAIADNHSVAKVERKQNGSYALQNTAAGDIVADTIYTLSGDDNGSYGYNLYDANSAYEIAQNEAQVLDLAIEYENCLLSGSSAAGKNVIFDQNGFVSVSGEQGDFAISMTFNDDYPTDWFTVSVTGKSPDNATMEMVDSGYVLTSEHLSDVNVHANNRVVEASVNFSTDYNSVLLYENNETTIGIAVDTDNNGTYETTIADSTHGVIGDCNGDGYFNVADVVLLQRWLLAVPNTNLANWKAADFIDDNRLDVFDLCMMKRALIG